ncbi:hypothetical protein [Brevibacillus migulae]|uniref:hypothetical protein n=1 Tax=Brevibacillus migulae TaxID=1644114 RepID=UPI00106E2C2C|nr:hypothetical protein [Brevibacillus migulae]
MKKKSTLALLLASTFLGGSIVGVSAQTSLKEIKAFLDPTLKLNLNGEDIRFHPNIPPIKYNNQIYLPANTILETFGLNSSTKYDPNSNTLSIGGPRYVDVSTKTGFYQIITNGNWRPSYQTRTKQRYSNWYKGVQLEVTTDENTDLNTFMGKYIAEKSKLDGEFSKEPVDVTYADRKAKVVECELPDAFVKTALIQNGSDFIVIEFFIDKTKLNPQELIEFDQILSTFNIQ